MQNQQYSFFFSDIVGYSKMVERDETMAHRMLKEHNKIIEESVVSNDGRVVKYIGDSVFAEFESSDNACIAGLTIQDNLKQRNSLSRMDEQIHIRLGIHTGEAIREEGDLFGNDINIASRIESIAQPESVFISDAVMQHIDSETAYCFRSVDNVKLKNIHSPQTLHKLYPNKKEWEQESSAKLVEALIENGVNFIDTENIHDFDTKSIGILIFKCLGDPYYGYGLCNDLISEFNRISQVYVSDIQDVISYKESELSLVDIAHKLEVDNMLDGVCRVEGNRIHVSIRMVSMESGKTIWKEDLSELTTNMNVLRGKIVKRVLEILEVEVPDFILEKMSKGMTANPEAYKLYHEGLYKIEIVKNADEYHEAIELFEKAIKHDANFLEAYAQHALTTYKMGHMEEAEELLDKALDISEELENEHGRAKLLEACGMLNAQSDRYKKAVNYFKKAIRIYVKYEDQLAESKTLNNISTCYINLNEPNKGIEVLERSIYLKEKLEKDNLLGTSLGQLGNAYRNKFLYTRAIASYRKSLGKFTRYNNEYHEGRVLLTLSRCFIDMGIVNEAQDYLKRSKNICLKFNEPLIMGWIKSYEAKIKFAENKYQDCINDLNESIIIFRKGNIRRPILELLLEMIYVHIKYDINGEIQYLLNEYINESRIIADSDGNTTSIDCINYYMNAIDKTAIDIDFENIEKKLTNMNLSENQYLCYWIIGKAEGYKRNKEKEKYYYSLSVKTINQLADSIGEDEYKKSYLNKRLINDIVKYYSEINI